VANGQFASYLQDPLAVLEPPVILELPL